MRRELLVVGVLGLVGVGLLLNPVYLFPQGGESGHRYWTEEIGSNATAKQALYGSDDVLTTNARATALETQVLRRDGLSVNGSVRSDILYRVVSFRGEFYHPTQHQTENGTRLSLGHLTPMEAVEHAAIPLDETAQPVHTAVETGSVTVYGHPVGTFERERIVEDDGDYYWVDRWRGVSSMADEESALVLRLCAFLAGIGCLLYAGERLWRMPARGDA
ncbi:hypothetical protein [Halapricum salinum]|uniref:Uncharacterized protein n=1 Tax=Halapricum salinum TaxID=1457250 RepID=A0A4D6HDA8_9EURY|nr:hypothetical protein [Halapricum salinum]QCC51148.1 hypothetical protein DV733_07790 [Halapricum salinum]